MVGRDGKKYRFVRDEDTAWANGKLVNPNLGDPIIAEMVRNNINPNRRTVSIEREGIGGISRPGRRCRRSPS